jgi:hypothetical protein
MFSSVNTYNFHSNVKEIKKISVNLLFRQRVMASRIFTHRDNPKLLLDQVGDGGLLVFKWAKSYGCLFYACFRHYLKKQRKISAHNHHFKKI